MQIFLYGHRQKNRPKYTSDVLAGSFLSKESLKSSVSLRNLRNVYIDDIDRSTILSLKRLQTLRVLDQRTNRTLHPISNYRTATP
jgi:hypothetical protein